MMRERGANAPVLISCAMAEETAPFLSTASEVQPLDAPLTGSEAHRVRLGDAGAAGEHVIILRSGIGIAAAAAAASWAIAVLRPRAVISAGTAGGLSRGIEVGDIAIAESSGYGTADASEFGYERGQVPGQPARFPASAQLLAAARASADVSEGTRRFGRILSGDTFVTARNVADMREAFPDAIAADMETAAIAQTARAYGTPFISVRSISDLCGPAAGQEFHMAVEQAATRSRDAVTALLAALAD